MSPRCIALALCLATPVICASETAYAADDASATQIECAESYEAAQERRAAGDLQSALEQLKLCVREECRDFMRADCSTWMGQVEAAMPTVVFAARRDGRDLSQVKVLRDGEVMTEVLDGAPISLNPGRYSFRFEASGSPPENLDLVIRAGEKNRIVRIDFSPSRPAGAPPQASAQPGQPPPEHPSADGGTNALPIVLGAVGVAGVAGFATFAVVGREQESDLQATCAPHCTDAQVAPVRTKYLVADVSLGVGILGLAASTYFFLQEPPAEESGTSSTWSVNFASRKGGGVAWVRAKF
jgi:hypothetical protein